MVLLVDAEPEGHFRSPRDRRSNVEAMRERPDPAAPRQSRHERFPGWFTGGRTEHRQQEEELLDSKRTIPKMRLIILFRRAAKKARRNMSEPELPRPEPKPIDEKLSLELKHLAEDAILRGRPNGEERCRNCLYYLNPDEEISYCWHPKIRILVGENWWCQWWEPMEEQPPAGASPSK